MSAEFIPVPKFALGKCFISPAALEKLTHQDVLRSVQRHQAGDWGDLDEHDRQVNERALQTGGRLVSIYSSAKGIRFYITTEADRSMTTVLLPDDY